MAEFHLPSEESFENLMRDPERVIRLDREIRTLINGERRGEVTTQPVDMPMSNLSIQEARFLL